MSSDMRVFAAVRGTKEKKVRICYNLQGMYRYTYRGCSKLHVWGHPGQDCHDSEKLGKDL